MFLWSLRLNTYAGTRKIRLFLQMGQNFRRLGVGSPLRKMVRDTEMHSATAIFYLRAHRELAAVKEISQLD